MKKLLSFALILILCVSLAACGNNEQQDPEDAPAVNSINVSISIIDSDGDDVDVEGFTPVENAPFSVEEGTNVLDATQIYCVSNDIDIEIGGSGDYVTSLMGVSEKDMAGTTGWIFKVNGESGSLGADEEILEEGDEISWEFVDFSTYSW